MDPLQDEWIIMGMKQMDSFDQDNESYLNVMVNGTALLEIWKSVYARAVYLKVLVPIEESPKEYKEQVWREVHDIAKGKLSKEEKIALCKALYTMKNFSGN